MTKAEWEKFAEEVALYPQVKKSSAWNVLDVLTVMMIVFWGGLIINTYVCNQCLLF